MAKPTKPQPVKPHSAPVRKASHVDVTMNLIAQFQRLHDEALAKGNHSAAVTALSRIADLVAAKMERAEISAGLLDGMTDEQLWERIRILDATIVASKGEQQHADEPDDSPETVGLASKILALLDGGRP